MRIAALLLLVATPAAAQAAGAKMVILNGDGGVAITDYPSMARCDLAKRALEALMAKGEPWAGATMTRVGVSIYCIPG